MKRFNSKEQLQDFLNTIDTRYGVYAEALWKDGRGVGSSSQLANSTLEILQHAGVIEELHAQDIIMQAKEAGVAVHSEGAGLGSAGTAKKAIVRINGEEVAVAWQSQDSLLTWLGSCNAVGLRQAELSGARIIADLAMVVDGGCYVLVTKDRGTVVQQLSDHRNSLTNIQKLCESEFGNALRELAADDQGVDPVLAILMPELREMVDEDGTSILEVDAVVHVPKPDGTGAYYFGEHKMAAQGDSDVRVLNSKVSQILDMSESQQLRFRNNASVPALHNSEVKKAFMAETMTDHALQKVDVYCKAYGIMRLRRGSGGGIVRAALAVQKGMGKGVAQGLFR